MKKAGHHWEALMGWAATTTPASTCAGRWPSSAASSRTTGRHARGEAAPERQLLKPQAESRRDNYISALGQLSVQGDPNLRKGWRKLLDFGTLSKLPITQPTAGLNFRHHREPLNLSNLLSYFQQTWVNNNDKQAAPAPSSFVTTLTLTSLEASTAGP